MTEFVIKLLHETREGLSLALNTELVAEETPIKMAWALLILRRLPDTPIWFPRGKVQTIRNIEYQLEILAEKTALELMTSPRAAAIKGVSETVENLTKKG